MEIQYKLKTQVGESLEVVQTGILSDIDGNLFESKNWWNGAIAYKKPMVCFYTIVQEVQLSLDLVGTGYGAFRFYKGIKYGANLNRVRNQKNRWGLTAWIELNASQESA